MDRLSSATRLRARLQITVIALGVAGSVMSVSLFALASPLLVNDFGVSFAALQWRTLLFWTAFGVGMPFFGRLSERLGARTQFLLGLGVFCVSMVLNAVTPNWYVFLLAAVVQGIADAIVVPVQSVMIRRLFAQGERGWAFGWQSGTLAAASLAGPPLGGLLLTAVSWRSIFWCLLAFGIVALALAALLLPRLAVKDDDRASGPLPWRSCAAFAVLCVCAQGLILPHGGGVAGLILAACVVAAAFVFVGSERTSRPRNRYFPKDILGNADFLLAGLRGLLFYFATNAIALYLPIYLQVVGRLSPATVGVAMVCAAIVPVTLSARLGRIADRNDARATALGFAMLATGVLALGVLGTSSGLVAVTVTLAFIGFGGRIVVPAINKFALETSPEAETGAYMGVFQSLQFVSIGLAGVLFASVMQDPSSASLITDAGFRLTCSISAALYLVALSTMLVRNRRLVKGA